MGKLSQYQNIKIMDKVIKFNETDFLIHVNTDNEKYVSVKCIYEFCDLNRASTIRFLKQSNLYSKHLKTRYTSLIGFNRNNLMINVEALQLWLNSINIKKVKERSREKLNLCKKELLFAIYNDTMYEKPDNIQIHINRLELEKEKIIAQLEVLKNR